GGAALALIAVVLGGGPAPRSMSPTVGFVWLVGIGAAAYGAITGYALRRALRGVSPTTPPEPAPDPTANGFALLPPEMAARSLSDREIVLEADDALRALEILVAARWAPISWARWAHGDERRRSSAARAGEGAPVRRLRGQPWEAFVAECARRCRQA